MKRAVRHWTTGAVAAAILGTPALLNLVANAVLRARYPVPGLFCPVNGYRMHLYCVGHGSPTVVLDAGGGNDWLIWRNVQQNSRNRHSAVSFKRMQGFHTTLPKARAQRMRSASRKMHLVLSLRALRSAFACGSAVMIFVFSASLASRPGLLSAAPSGAQKTLVISIQQLAMAISESDQPRRAQTSTEKSDSGIPGTQIHDLLCALRVLCGWQFPGIQPGKIFGADRGRSCPHCPNSLLSH